MYGEDNAKQLMEGFKENVDEVLSLDMFGQVNSLNASNAGAIAIYEVVRQRSK